MRWVNISELCYKCPIMSVTDYRSRIYARYLETGDGAPYDRPEDAPAGLRDFLRDAVRRHFPPAHDAAIIDLGCGHGLLVHAARQAGYSRISGIDISPQQVAQARRLGIEGIGEGDAGAALEALAPASQDAVITFDLLEHLADEALMPFVDGVFRALRPGGRWIIHTVNAESPFFGRARFGDVTHRRAFTRASLRQLLTAAGFARIDCFEDAPVPGRPSAMLRWLAWKIVRLPALVFLIAECGGDGRNAILSQNLLCRAVK